MKRLRRFTALEAHERWLVCRAVVLGAADRAALWVMPLRWVLRPARLRRTISPRLAAIPAWRLSWAVQLAARQIPAATCLTQALALQRLLTIAGRSAEVRIGVAKDSARGFGPHAWVEHGGEVLLGNNGELDRYLPILTLCVEDP